MSRLEYYSDMKRIVEDSGTDCLLCIVPNGIKDKMKLFEILAKDLQFPSYFGKNWDALDEVLADFSWIPGYEVKIIHEDYPLEGEEKKTYLSVLTLALDRCDSSRNYDLKVYFPKLT